MKLNKIIFSNLFDFTFLILVLYTPQFIVFNYVINTLYVLIIISLIFIIKNNFRIRFPKWLLYVITLQLFYFICISIYNGYVETFILKELIIFPFLFLSFGYIHEYLKSKNYNKNRIIKYLEYSLIFNFSIIIIFSIFRDLNPILHSFIHITDKQYKYIYETILIRHSGLTVSGFSYLSFKAATLYSIIVSFYLFQKKIPLRFYVLSLIL